MTDKELQERIKESDLGDALEIIQELLAENKQLRKDYADILYTHKYFVNKPIYAHCDKLEAENKQLKEKLNHITKKTYRNKKSGYIEEVFEQDNVIYFVSGYYSDVNNFLKDFEEIEE